MAIIGYPNAGKSTLLNALLGQKLSIVTRKAQTTRHRIVGIMSDDMSQVVWMDTPGVITVWCDGVCYGVECVVGGVEYHVEGVAR